ncbi:CHAP domain-containing protein [Geodermatophilus normandii]|uniref:CHAP domain-containing protein n=1 Tax=Geodermatophilus normandii TaxID=1137989 RepID=A0A317QLN2_9ACTN|nr:CHAP domain-containing protein [Geodermatophilus normandii]PWW23804.1 CHAP domain-containing protein [Geodermatophilus normandii]
MVVARLAVLLLVLAAAWCHGLPTADARGHHLRPGPPGGVYPLATDRGLALDPWGFVARQCTSYAAWYLNARGVPFGLLTRGPAGNGLFTSAGSWDDAALAAGFPVRSTPAVGSIAQWNPGERSPEAPWGAPWGAAREAGGYGHVAVVQDVLPNGSVLVSEYDGEDGTFHERVTRAPRYLYVGLPGDAAAPSARAGRPGAAAAAGPDTGG